MGTTQRPLVAVPDYLDQVLPYAQVRAAVEAAGGRLELFRCQTHAELLARCGEAVALIVHWFPIDRQLLQALPRLQLLVRYGIGYDMIDVEAATELGVIVCNTPFYCIDEVADHTLALLLALARKLKPLSANAEAGRWDQDATGRLDRRSIRRLRGRTLGLVGFGRIARAVAERAQGFGMRLVACDPYVDPAQAGYPTVTPATLEQVLADSDFVSLHVPLTGETRGLINEARLRLFKPTAVLINASRGAVVDEDALIAALRAERLAGAGLDVLAEEPPAPDNPLLHMDNVIVTPHYAAQSAEALAEQEREASEPVAALLRGEWPPYVVNPGVVPRAFRQAPH